MIRKKNIYGTKELIHGSILLTSNSTGRKKWFLVCEIEDTPENRQMYIPRLIGKRNLRLTSDFNISQKTASLMQQISANGLVPYKGYRF